MQFFGADAGHQAGIFGEGCGDTVADGGEFVIELGPVADGFGTGVEAEVGEGFVDGGGDDVAVEADLGEEVEVEGVVEGFIEGAEAMGEVGGPEGARLVDGVVEEPAQAFLGE